jgi:hypothetical protein
MFWFSAGTSAPSVCPTGNALVVDQITGAEYQAAFGRSSYPRPHLYCQLVGQTNPWMCVSTRLP